MQKNEKMIGFISFLDNVSNITGQINGSSGYDHFEEMYYGDMDRIN